MKSNRNSRFLYEPLLNEIYKNDKFADTLIWSVSFLSIFAIGDSNAYFNSKKEKDLIALLEKEKQALLRLASAGCEIRCIISPANPKNVSENLEYALYRTIQLLEFLNNKNGDAVIESALENIYWTTTEYPQRNVYVLGDLSFYEGYKKGSESFGYGLSSRQTYEEVILSNTNLYEKFFDELTCKNLYNPEWKDKDEIKDLSPATLRRESVIFKIEESKLFLETLIGLKGKPNKS